MMWRLNFLVVACCVVLRNDYMLYYICPMHTIFTVLVYAALGIANHVNRSRIGMGMKLLACVLVVMIVWDFPGVFYALWKPFAFLVAYTDPRNPNPDSLHGVPLSVFCTICCPSIPKIYISPHMTCARVLLLNFHCAASGQLNVMY